MYPEIFFYIIEYRISVFVMLRVDCIKTKVWSQLIQGLSVMNYMQFAQDGNYTI